MSNNTKQLVTHFELDRGYTTVSIEQGESGKKTISTWVYGLAVRSPYLGVESIREGYILAVLAARRFKEGEEDDKTKFIERLTEIIMSNITININ
jgi:hypothetical protein